MPAEIARVVCTRCLSGRAGGHPHRQRLDDSEAMTAAAETAPMPGGSPNGPGSPIRSDCASVSPAISTTSSSGAEQGPARRYASVDQFSEDIRRHLAGLPVTARKDTFGYRAAKFVGRNRTGVAAGVAGPRRPGRRYRRHELAGAQCAARAGASGAALRRRAPARQRVAARDSRRNPRPARLDAGSPTARVEGARVLDRLARDSAIGPSSSVSSRGPISRSATSRAGR